MKCALALSLALGLATSVVSSNEQMAPRGDAEAGAGKAAACAACHGVDGNSASPEWPKLAGQNETYIARQLALFKSGVRDNAVMLGFAATLTDQDMHDLGAYYQGLAVQPGLADDAPITQAGPYEGQPAYVAGQQIYMGGIADRGIPACMACHGPAGAGVYGTGYPAVGGQHADYNKLKLQWFREGNGFDQSQNGQVMQAVAKGLTDLEIEVLATFMEGLAPR